MRKIVRRALNICENVFKNEQLLQNAIVPEIVNSLGDVYPELERNFDNIRKTFSDEHEHYKSVRIRNRKDFQSLNITAGSDLTEEDTIDFAGFAIGFRDVEKLMSSDSKIQSLPIDFVYERLHMNLGLTEELIEKIAIEKDLTVDMENFAQYKQHQKLEAKMNLQKVDNSLLNSLVEIDVPKTDYRYMYDYAFNGDLKEYIVKPITATVHMCKSNGNGLHHIILDRTNFYHTAGGQDGDIGKIVDANGTEFIVDAVNIHKGHVIHSGRFKNSSTPEFSQNQEVTLYVDSANRTALSQHHTAMHLLQAAIKHVTQQIVFQQSSHVSSSELKCNFGSIGKRIDLDQINQIEELIQRIIGANVSIQTSFLMAHDLYALDNVTTIPGEIYPDENIRVLKVNNPIDNFISIEPCCGTHAHSTADLQDFCITAFKFNASNRSYDIAAIAGKSVSIAKQNEQNFLSKFHPFKSKVNQEQSPDTWKMIEKEAAELSKELIENQMPYVMKAKVLSEMEEIKKSIHLAQRAHLRKTILSEMIEVLSKRTENNESFIIHVLNTSEALEESLMADAERVCHDLPVIIINVANNKIVHGRASIPLKYTTNKFNAKHWIQELGQLLNIACQANKKKKQFALCSFIDVPDKEFTPSELKKAVEKATIAAREAFTKLVSDDERDRSSQEEDLIAQIEDVRKRVESETNLNGLVNLEARSKEIRNYMKNNIFLYTTRQRCMTELTDIDEQIYEARSSAEKYDFFYLSFFFCCNVYFHEIFPIFFSILQGPNFNGIGRCIDKKATIHYDCDQN